MESSSLKDIFKYMKCNFIGHVISDKDKQTLDLEGIDKLKVHCECGVFSMLIKTKSNKFKIYPVYNLPLN